MPPIIEHFHVSLTSHRGRPILVWVRDPLVADPQAAHGLMERESFMECAKGRSSGTGLSLHQQIMSYMQTYRLHLYVVERGPVGVLGVEDMKAIVLRAYAGEFHQPARST